MTPPAPVVILLDVDNTLLDNDAIERDLRQHLTDAFGAACQGRYWEIFEQLRARLGYADYLGSLQQYRLERPLEPEVLKISLFLLNYPFASRLYPRALDVVAKLQQYGRVVILTDGDVVFQPRKIEQSGLWAAVSGHVLIYVHKEEMLEDVERRYPAERYVMVDDKLRILTAIKRVWHERVTTVFPRQGHYASDASAVAGFPAPDLTIERIGDLLDRDLTA
jgi:FMN phosphatase YigB (HAD superfamily)